MYKSDDVTVQVRLDELYEQLMRELRNQHNWVCDAEQRLVKQPTPSEDESQLQQQADDQKVSYCGRYTDNRAMLLSLNCLKFKHFILNIA